MYSISCASGTANLTYIDNSGAHRQVSVRHTIYKSCGAHARTEYKMNFGAGVSTSWKNGVVKWTNGYEAKTVTDTFYYPNTARGVWVRLCNYWTCGSSTYLDNPYN